MKSVLGRLIYGVPRLIAILYAMFVSVFALDVFDEHLAFWHLILALFIHLIPTFVLIATLALAWKWEWIGGIGYLALGVFYIYNFAGRFPWYTYVLVAGPAFLIGAFFALNWALREKIRRALKPTA